jgi:hypothetical protein
MVLQDASAIAPNVGSKNKKSTAEEYLCCFVRESWRINGSSYTLSQT